MKSSFRTLGLGLAALTLPVVAVAQFSANFETNQAASFNVVIASSTNDANADFLYDSSTHVQGAGAAVTIGPAPNTVGTSTRVLRLNANLADATDTDAVNVYPNATGLGTNWVMQWDCWQNYNGDALGGSGSTNMLLFGAANANTVGAKALTTPSIAGDGFYFTMSGEGGATADYRFYSGTGTIVANNAGVSWFGGAGGANLNNLDPVWGDATTGFFLSPPFQTAGAMGKQWIVIRLAVNGTAATVSIRRPGDVGFTNVGTATVPATATVPFIGFSDINTGLASPVSDQFVLVDNLTVAPASASVGEWGLY